MKLYSETGFTIVETMLFLAITGLLIMGAFAGVGNSINNQKYRDSVTSLQSKLQEQYSDTSSVDNDRSASAYMTCDTNANVSTGGSTPLGQSDCVILGKYITYSSDDNKLVIRKVIGYIAPGTLPLANDVLTLKAYNMKPLPSDDISSEIYNIEWGSSLVGDKNADMSHLYFSMLILRSPLSGVSRTFIQSGSAIPDANMKSLLDSSLSQSLKMCVKDTNTVLGSNNRSAINIIANTTGASGVQTQGGETSKCN